MTAKIKQHVVHRHARPFSFFTELSVSGTRVGRRRAGNQLGAVSSSALTVSFAIITLIGLVLLGFLYLYQVSGTTMRGNEIQQLETRVLELGEKQRELELEGAQLRSLQTVEDNVRELNLVRSDTVAFLVPQPDQVALAR